MEGQTGNIHNIVCLYPAMTGKVELMLAENLDKKGIKNAVINNKSQDEILKSKSEDSHKFKL